MPQRVFLLSKPAHYIFSKESCEHGEGIGIVEEIAKLNLAAAPKDVRERLGHSDINLNLNVYADSTREFKRSGS